MEKDLLIIYRDKFGENFPTYCIDVSDGELNAILEKCIAENKPYVIEHNKNIIY